jgi:hypothetical protein
MPLFCTPNLLCAGVLDTRIGLFQRRVPTRADQHRVNVFCFPSRSSLVWSFEIERFASPPPYDAVDYAKFRSRSHDAVIRVYDDAGNVIQTHQHKGDFKGG